MKPESQRAYTQLCESLEGLVKHYRSLLNIVRKEKEILVNADLDKLNDNNRVKEELIIQVSNVEKQRIQHAKSLAESLNMDVEGVKLLDFCPHLSAEKSERMRNYHSVLDLLMKRVQEYHHTNKQLVHTALESITGAMNSVKDTLQENPVYQKKKEEGLQGNLQSGQIVSREA